MMVMRYGLVVAALLGLSLSGSSCGGGSPPNPPPPIQPPISGWTQFYGAGAAGTSFDFPPAPDSVHYVVEPGAAKLGQTITMTFTISGSGTWGIKDPTDAPPPTIHLLLWENNDNLTGQGMFETFREWCGRTEITNPGQYTVSCPLDPAHWTGVFGQTPSSAAFQQLLGNLYAVGFTFGGASFAGHGLYSATGKFHFNLDTFVVQ